MYTHNLTEEALRLTMGGAEQGNPADASKGGFGQFEMLTSLQYAALPMSCSIFKPAAKSTALSALNFSLSFYDKSPACGWHHQQSRG